MSTTWQVELDPTAILPERTPLALNGREIAIDGKKGIDWGEAAIKAYMAEGQYGEGVTAYRVPNRIVTIPLVVGARMGGSVNEEEAAREELRQKVALIQRLGGALKRQRKGGEPLYADIVNASLTIPDIYGETGGVEPGVMLKLECLPDFYGNEIALDAVSGEGMIASVLTQGGNQAAIAGNYPARTRIIVTEKSNNNQRGLLYGFRSTRYTSSERARLWFDAAEQNMINGAGVLIHEGAYSGHWAELIEPEKETWHPFVEMTIGEVVNYVHNPTFEAPSTTGWTAGANTTFATNTEQAFSGTHCLALTATGSGAVKASTTISKAEFKNSSLAVTVPGTTFTASAYFRGKTNARSCKLKIIWLTSGGAEISTTTGTAENDTTSSWTRVSVTGAAPSNAAEMKVEVEVAGLGASEVQYLDAVQFAPGQHPSPTPMALSPATCGTGQKAAPTTAQL